MIARTNHKSKLHVDIHKRSVKSDKYVVVHKNQYVFSGMTQTVTVRHPAYCLTSKSNPIVSMEVPERRA